MQQKRGVVLGAAVSATVIAMSGVAFGALPQKYLSDMNAHPGRTEALRQGIATPKGGFDLLTLGGGAAAASLGGAEASGTWVGPAFFRGSATQFPTNSTFGFWTDPANWSGGVPNGAADIATFNEMQNVGGVIALFNTGDNITLSQLVDNTESGLEVVTFRTGASGNIAVPAGGFTFNKTIKSFNTAPSGARFVTDGEGLRSVSMSGSGKVTFTGAGDKFLGRLSPGLSGTVSFNGGRVMIVGGQVLGSDQPASPALSAQYLGTGPIEFNGGALFLGEGTPGAPGQFDFDRPVFVGPNGGDVQSSFANWGGGANQGFPLWTPSAPISGTGTLRIGDGSDAAIQSASPGFTGNMILDDYVFMFLQGDGALPNMGTMINFGRLDVDNISLGANNNRLSDTGAHRMFGSEFHITDSADTDVSETIGNYVSEYGTNMISMETNTNTQNLTLNANSIVRNNNSTVYIRGRNLGAAGTGVGRINLTTAPTQIGGIVPWIYGVSGPFTTSNTSTGVGVARPATYDANGLRPLSDGEMTASIGAGGNVLLVGGGSGGGTVNSLTVSGAGAVTGSAITVTSGLVIGDTPGQTISNDLTTANEMVLIQSIDTDPTGGGAQVPASGLTISGKITAPNGFTKGGYGDLVLTNATNSISGPITLGMGRTFLTEDTALGTSADPIRLVAGTYADNVFTNESHLVNGKANGTLTISKNLIVLGETAATTGSTLANSDNTSTMRLNGNVTIGTSPAEFNNLGLTLQFGTFDFAGTISGPGSMLLRATNSVGTLDVGAGGQSISLSGTRAILRNANPGWSGAIEIGTNTSAIYSEMVLAADGALGTGPLWLDGASLFSSIDGSTRTITNDVTMFVGPAVRGSGKIVFAGNFDLNIGNRSVIVATGSQAEISGTVRNGGIVKSGEGTLTLSGNNTAWGGVLQIGFVGNATLATRTGGAVVIKSATGLGNGGLPGINTTVVTDSSLVLDPGVAEAPINGAEDITFNGAGYNGLGAIRNVSGSNTVGDLLLTNYTSVGTLNAGVGTIYVEGGSQLSADELIDQTGPVVAGDPTPPTTPATFTEGSGTLTKTGSGVLQVNGVFNSRANVGTLSAFNAGAKYSYLVTNKVATGGIDVQGGTFRISTGGTNNAQAKHTVVKSLSVNTGAGAKFDLTNNSLLVDYTGSSPRAAIEALITSGYAGGAWTGAGITSSSANTGNFALGVGDLSDTGFSGDYLGTPIDGDVTIVRFTRYGDANLDGTVGIADFARLGANYNQPGRWATGDFNFDGTVGIADFSLLGANYNLSAIDPAGRGGAVPEPTTLGVVALGAAGLMARRRRNA